MKNIRKIIIFFLIFPFLVFAQASGPVEEAKKIVASLFDLIVKISGAAALLMMVWGGFEYMMAAGNPSKISAAKDKIYSAIVGLLIVLCSYLILKIINPEVLR